MGKPKKAAPAYNGEPWEQMVGETAQQYERFCAYRDMRYKPPDKAKDPPKLDLTSSRSIRALANAQGIARQHLEVLSSAFRWKERCDAYDAYILGRIREKNEANILKMRETHASLANQMLKKATRRLLTIKDEEITAADIVRLVDVGVKIERLSRGESTERQEIAGEAKVHHSGTLGVKAVDGIDLSGLSDEELGQLEQLLGKLHPEPGV